MKDKSIISIMVPARNEEHNIKETIDCLLMLEKKSEKYKFEIVVVDDGSRDKTVEILKKLPVSIVQRDDRGYSALGLPELAETHNSGFKYISDNFENIKYLMVVGADTTFDEDYIDLLLDEFDKNENLVMAAGRIENTNAAKNAVRGSGRIIEYKFWTEFGELLPTNYYSWESYPIYYALMKGYDTMTIKNAIMYTKREPLALVDWKRYGIQMKEIGYRWPYVLYRGMNEMFRLRFKRAFRLFIGFLQKPVNKYPNEMREYVRNYQKNQIIKKFNIFNL